MTLAELNALPSARAEDELARCCGSRAWARAVAGRRPFKDAGALGEAADAEWWKLSRADWLEAFSHHPRIGERAAGWASKEQAGVAGASAATVRALIEGNEAFERRFGHVFLVCATGKSADEMLELLRARLSGTPEAELRVAAGEQAKITRLRLTKLLEDSA
jgi:2-oxo-4-hydroxy-4-carboxy-5-ureidoimidazoline decarboxylase